MRKIFVVLLLTFAVDIAMASTTVVNCAVGQSLNSAISTLNKQGPNLVLVHGICTEYVNIIGFENLTIKGNPSATIDQPNTIPNNLFLSLVRIDASRSVTIDGLQFGSTSSGPDVIGIGAGSTDMRLRNLSIVGGFAGIEVFERSQVSIANVSVKNAGYASLAIFDGSDVHVEDCLFEDLTGTTWHSGIFLGASHVTIRRSNIHNMQVGIFASASIVDTSDFNTYYPRGSFTDVVIDNPSGGINFNGVEIDAGSSLNVGSAKLRILNAGRSSGGSSGGILVSGASFVNGNSNLIISGSVGQGIYATGDSHVTLDGSSITGSQHGGLVAVNLSTISVVPWDQPVTVSGNAVDVFCDSNSVITGGVKIVNASTVQCQNLLPWDSVPVP